MRYMSMIRLGLAAALIGLAAPAPAHAQFGKLMKKAKHAMDPAKSDSARGTAADDASMRRPAGMVELTSARVGGLIDGLQAKLHLVSTADGIGVAAMRNAHTRAGRTPASSLAIAKDNLDFVAGHQPEVQQFTKAVQSMAPPDDANGRDEP